MMPTTSDDVFLYSVELRSYRNRSRPTVQVLGENVPIYMVVYADARGNCIRVDTLEPFEPSEEWQLIEAKPLPGGHPQ
jgi:hypothetical protein